MARNSGIRKANGNYILNHDSDDYFEPSFCEKAVEKFIEDDTIKVYEGSTLRVKLGNLA